VYGVVYMGIFAGIIMILLGIFLAANGSGIYLLNCFSETTSANITGNLTQTSYSVSCLNEVLPWDRNFINAFGIILMFVGAGVIVDFINYVKTEPEKERAMDYRGV